MHAWVIAQKQLRFIAFTVILAHKITFTYSLSCFKTQISMQNSTGNSKLLSDRANLL